MRECDAAITEGVGANGCENDDVRIGVYNGTACREVVSCGPCRRCKDKPISVIFVDKLTIGANFEMDQAAGRAMLDNAII